MEPLAQADLSSDDDGDEGGRGGSSGSNKRVMANRQSAQRSRMRKLQFISDLEANVQSLENDIKSMNPMHSALRQKHAGVWLPQSITGPTLEKIPATVPATIRAHQLA